MDEKTQEIDQVTQKKELTPFPAQNKRKVIFATIVVMSVLLFFIFFLFVTGVGKKESGKGFNPKSNEVEIWSVNMPATLFEDLNAGFNKYVDRTDMKLRVRNFTEYGDFLDIFPRAVKAGVSPDVVLSPNHDGCFTINCERRKRFLDEYTVSLGENIINLTDFENRFHGLFFDELVFEEKQKNKDGKNIIVKGIRGIPVGFEPIGIYYNIDLIPTAPEFWENMSEQLSEDAKTNKIPAISVGYGRATPLSYDLLPFLTMQYKGSKFDSYLYLNSIESRSVINRFLDYREEPNNLNQFHEEYLKYLTNVDLFVRGKVATLVGYPSTEKDIQLAIKRAKKDDVYDDNFEDDLRWKSTPQVEKEIEKQLGFARYMYFVLTKNGKNRDFEKPSNDPAIKFLQYLNTAEAQEIFFRNYEYYLPSQLALLADKKLAINSRSGDFPMTVGDWYIPDLRFAPYDKGIPQYFNYIVEKALDEPNAKADEIGGNAYEYMKCKMNHLSDPDTYETACECTHDTQKNNNHFWPVCQWGL